MKTSSLHALGLVTLLAGASPVFGYELKTVTDSGGATHTLKWSSTKVILRAASDQFTSGSGYRDALKDAVYRWNDNPSKFSYEAKFDMTSSDLSGGKDGICGIWFSGSLGAGVLGLTTRWYSTSTGKISEADVEFDSGTTWSTSHEKTDTYKYGGNYPLQTTALHELGHALGLQHEADEYNIMGNSWSHLHVNGSHAHFYPGEDACDGAVALYGLDSTNREDVAVVHWKYYGVSGEYSAHTRTEIYDSSGAPLSYITDSNGEPLYKVSPGDTVKLELTFENNGSTTQSPLVKYYISTNDKITTKDHWLDDRTPTITRNNVYTMSNSLVIPKSLVIGGVSKTLSSGETYYLGAVIDADAKITEVNEQNNATYVGIYIK